MAVFWTTCWLQLGSKMGGALLYFFCLFPPLGPVVAEPTGKCRRPPWRLSRKRCQHATHDMIKSNKQKGQTQGKSSCFALPCRLFACLKVLSRLALTCLVWSYLVFSSLLLSCLVCLCLSLPVSICVCLCLFCPWRILTRRLVPPTRKQSPATFSVGL